MVLYIPLFGQGDITVTISSGESAEVTFNHYKRMRYGLGITEAPRHGSVTDPTLLSGDLYQISYQPDPGFHGTDVFSYSYMECISRFSCRREVTVTVIVEENKVIANMDLAYTDMNASAIPINVTANDESSNGVLRLISIPMANNGTAEIVSGQGIVEFTPDPNFEGIANFNYTVCDGTGACDRATVNVAVIDPSKQNVDTTRIFTNKNEPVPVFIPPFYELLDEPDFGLFSRAGEVPYYTPEQDFTGTDYLHFASQINERVIEVVVIDYVRNAYAMDDQVFVSPGDFVEVDVLENDAFGYSSCFRSIGQPKYGRLTTTPDAPGFVTYQAPEQFTGVDKFTYTISTPDCSEEEETATVSVYVSNYEPAYSKFFMSTPRLTPLVIGYNVPINDFSFDIESQGDLGKVIFLEGQRDTIIYGQQVSGYNLILYLPNPDVSTGTDEFELTYCNTSTNDGTCRLRKGIKVEIDILDVGESQEPKCFDDCIWSGDTNFDGIVNIEDLLPIGVYMGEIGQVRRERDMNQWYGQYGDDWQDEKEQSADIKHVDTDGDSIITSWDTLAINRFYGNTHSMTAAKIPSYDFQIRLEGNVVARPGDLIELDLVVGSTTAPANDLYGFTFSIPYNKRFFKPEGANIGFDRSSWIKYNSPVLTMTRSSLPGLLEAGFTRTNGLPISGFGKVGTLRLVIHDDISGIKDGKIDVELGDISTATATLGNGQNVGVIVAPHTITIDLGQSEQDDTDTAEPSRPLDQRLKAFPNPAGDLLNLHLNGGEEITSYQLFNMTGQLVKSGQNIQQRALQINLSDMNSGMYALRVITPSGLTSRMIEVQR